VVTGDDMTRRYIAQHPERFFFSSTHQESYEPGFCADFGPVNLRVVHEFCGFMLDYWDEPTLEGRHLVFYCERPINVRSNTAFLLAAFMVTDPAGGDA